MTQDIKRQRILDKIRKLQSKTTAMGCTEAEALAAARAVGHLLVRGIDEREVQPDRVRKSVGAETTFRQELTSEEDMLAALRTLTDQICERLRRLKTAAMTVTVKMKYHDFVQVTRSKTFEQAQQDAHEVFPTVAYLLHHPIPPARPVRLLGISLSNLTYEKDNRPRQLTLPW